MSVAVMSVAACSVMSSSGQFHPWLRSSASVWSSSNRRRIKRAGLPAAMA
jgi:hypothetical protein